jgi:hypothetical protein
VAVYLENADAVREVADCIFEAAGERDIDAAVSLKRAPNLRPGLR